MQRLGLEPARVQSVSQFSGAELGAAKDQGPGHGFYLEQTRDRCHPVGCPDDIVALLGIFDGQMLGVNCDRCRCAHIVIGEAADLVRQRRRKERGLARLWGLAHDGLDVVDKAHAQHFIRLIQHQETHGAEVEYALFDQVQHPPRRADDNVDAALEAGHLARVGLPTIDGQYAHIAVLPIPMDRPGDLVGQLAGGRDHQSLHLGACRVQCVQHGQRERRRLAGAGLCLAQYVPPLQEQRDGLYLNGGRAFVAQLVYRLQQRRMQPQGLKRVDHAILLAEKKRALPIGKAQSSSTISLFSLMHQGRIIAQKGNPAKCGIMVGHRGAAGQRDLRHPGTVHWPAL